MINGGFGLRDKGLMVELCNNKIINSGVKDIFYTLELSN